VLAFWSLCSSMQRRGRKLGRSALSSTTGMPTDVLTQAVRKEALRSLSWDAAMPPLLSVATGLVSQPLLMAPVPSAAKSTPLSVLLGTKTFQMPPMRASPKPPVRVQLLPQLYRLSQPGTVLISLPQATLVKLRQLNSFATRPPSLT